jgi:hypothetical protein
MSKKLNVEQLPEPLQIRVLELVQEHSNIFAKEKNEQEKLDEWYPLLSAYFFYLIANKDNFSFQDIANSVILLVNEEYYGFHCSQKQCPGFRVFNNEFVNEFSNMFNQS